MIPEPPNQLLAAAIEHHRAGRLQDAERIYRQILTENPNNTDALRNLGLLAHQVGHSQAAIELLQGAIRTNPADASSHNTLGEALRGVGRFEEAIAAYKAALSLNPNYPEATNNLGIALHQTGDTQAAIAQFNRAMQLRPGYASPFINLGNVLLDSNEPAKAIEQFQTALQHAPNHPVARGGIAASLHQLGDVKQAIEQYRLAMANGGQNNPDLHVGLARVYRDLGQLTDAINSYRAALALNPRDPIAHNNLAEALRNAGLLASAEAEYRAALSIDPNLSEACGNLGGVLAASGQHDAAIDAYRKAIDIKPSNRTAHSGLLLEMNYTGADAAKTFEEHLQWAQRHAASIEPISRPRRARSAKLRIGYVSPDFREHAAGHFIEPVLANHNRAAVEVVCYSDSFTEDAATGRMRGYGHEWRDISRATDESLARMIVDDRIDVLVDLAGHTARNRLLVFARKPAPVQVSWIGYANTTGLCAINYRFTDALADPPGNADKFHSEKLFRLPSGFLCYRPPDDAPEVAPPPYEANGVVTFGSFNNLAKISPATLSAWSKILAAVPKSRLLIKATGLLESATQQLFRAALAASGIDINRVILAPPQNNFREHLAAYANVDIALDTFPYNGTTTTCEALWMGVPVIALAGNTHASRVGLSLLTRRGMPKLVATSVEHYISKATTLAQAPRRLPREKMRASPLLDGARFTRDVEAAFKKTCAENS